MQDLLVKVLTPSRSIKFKRSNLTLIPDVVSYSTTISGCEKGKRWEEALQLLLEMLHSALMPKTIYSVVQVVGLLHQAVVWNKCASHHFGKILYGLALREVVTCRAGSRGP